MGRSRSVLVGVLVLGIGCLLVAMTRLQHRATLPLPTIEESPSIVRKILSKEELAPHPHFAGLDLARIAIDETDVTAPAAGGHVARLTLDPDLQRFAKTLLAAYKLPEAAIVMMDVGTGRLLAYASHLQSAPARDLCVEATAPAASVFKIVTAAALVETAGLTADTRQCYSGGEQRIMPIDLIDNPRRDRWCVTLAGAMGRSINTVFARLAQKHLAPDALQAEAKAFGFGAPVPFDVPVEPSLFQPPSDPLGFARTAAGFWNTTLSPLQAVLISATIARGGEPVRPYIVDEFMAPNRMITYRAVPSEVGKRAVSRDAAQAVATMMDHTVSEGTSYKAFHDGRGKAFLPGISVSSKTGTLSDAAEKRFYTWFTGYAPSKPVRDIPPVAISVLVVNGAVWQFKANLVAREMLRAYFSQQKVPSVTRPQVATVSLRRK